MNKRQRKKHLKKLINKTGFSFKSSLGYRHSKWQIQYIKLLHNELNKMCIEEHISELICSGATRIKIGDKIEEIYLQKGMI